MRPMHRGGFTTWLLAGVALVLAACADTEEPAVPDAATFGYIAEEGAALRRNACGGAVALVAEPGEPCGDCFDGVLVCDGVDRLRCHGATQQRNGCGTCEPLAVEPGSPCGCAGAWTCDGPSVRCEDPVERNVCGGCASLDLALRVGSACADGTGIAVCATPNDVVCRAAGANVCGGEGALILGADVAADARPGDACGACGRGSVVCADENRALACDVPDTGRNQCGTCTVLRAAPGTQCGCGGTGRWACDPTGAGVVCEGADAPNACGGCEPLEAAPGSPCDGGQWACTGPEQLRCVASDALACGAPLFPGEPPGTPCGPCDDGTFVCASSANVECVGATDVNACGGCGTLAGEIGQRCATGRVWACDEVGGARCVGQQETNACGGVSALSVRPGEPCGACGDGVFVCISDEDVACLGEGQSNACGGCGELGGVPGGPCGLCNTGRWACDGPEDVRCAGEDPDAEFLQYLDLDEDGFGDTEQPALRCPGTPLYARRNGDCDDTRGDVFPGATEACDDRDNDCDGVIDDGFLQFRDEDGDGFGDPSDARIICGVAEDFVPVAGDCYDRNPNARPGQTSWFRRDRGDGSFDYDCDGVEQPVLPDIGQCGIPPIGCGFEPAGQRDGWLQAPIPACGTFGVYLFNCLPIDDGCEPQVNEARQECR